MAGHPLDNPIWSSLTTRHASLGTVLDSAARYREQVAPFAAVRAADAPLANAQLQSVANDGESLYLVGVAPDLGTGWRVERHTRIAQMVCAAPSTVRAGPEAIELGEAHVADMLDLTARVFPGFFRPRTLEMGRYIGIYHERVLAAMAGERMHLEGYQEISAVCTHPDFLGRGYAQRLVAQLSREIADRGDTPFLHVYRENSRAMSLYEYVGYRWRRDIDLWHVTRAAA